MVTIQEVIRRLAPIGTAWAIREARDGDGTVIARMLRSDGEIPREVREFLADIVEGKIKLPRRKKLTILIRMTRYWREREVAWAVRDEMEEVGRQRDKNLRTALMQKWADVFGTTPANVERFLHLPKSRRFLHLPKSRRK